MQKKRLEKALKASRLMQLGFRVNHHLARPDKMDLLYTVNCATHRVQFTDQVLYDELPPQPQISKHAAMVAAKRGTKPLARIEEAADDDEHDDDSALSSGSSDSETAATGAASTRRRRRRKKSNDRSNKSSSSHHSNKSSSDNFEEKIEILCLKFNEPANLVAVGDSNGTIRVGDFILS
jgi:hypothetical protein